LRSGQLGETLNNQPQPSSNSTPFREFEGQLHGLLTEPDFLRIQQQKFRPNLFETVAASHRELWHTAFLKWLLDPQSYHGLSDFPLKRFLFAAYRDGLLPDCEERPDLSLGMIETLDLSTCIFQKEWSIKGGGRIDLLGTCEDKGLRIVIENKVEAREGRDQTIGYWQHMQDGGASWDYDIPIFLTPDEAQKPACTKFIVVTYQVVCDTVLKPCISHPGLSVESRYLLEQYLMNLGKPMKGGKVMARPHQELCEEIYRKYKDVLDEIFLAVKQEAPAAPDVRERAHFGTPLTRLFDANLVSKDDILFSKFHGVECLASFERHNDGTVVIRLDDEEYRTPSAAGKAIRQMPTPGWDFWRVRTKEGIEKGTLSELRQRLPEVSEQTNLPE
jgi:PD-(D/E)XK nuclease superfamily